jgi:hypothetical protein
MYSFDPFFLCHQIPRETLSVEDLKAQNFRNPTLMRHIGKCILTYVSNMILAQREVSNYFPRGTKKSS